MDRLNKAQYWALVIYIGIMFFGALLALADHPTDTRAAIGIIIMSAATAIGCYTGILPHILDKLLNR